MMDGMIKSLFAVMGIKPEEGQRYIVETVKTIQSVDDRLARIEAALTRLEGSSPNVIQTQSLPMNGSANLAAKDN